MSEQDKAAEPTTLAGDEGKAAPDNAGANADGQKATVGNDQPKAEGTLLTNEPAPPTPVVPDSYDLKLPENTPLDATVTERVTALAKSAGLTDATHAQAILDAIHGEALSLLDLHQEATKKGGAIWQEQVNALEQQARADKEIGGDHLTQSVTQAKQVLDRYATKEFAAFLDEAGLGSHPEMIRLLVRVNKALGEDKMIQGEPPKPKPKSRAERIWTSLPAGQSV